MSNLYCLISKRKLPGGLSRLLSTVSMLLFLLLVAPAGADHSPLPPPPEVKDFHHWSYFPGAAGTDIEFLERDNRTYAFAASIGEGFKIFDITDRAHPSLVATYASPGYQNDIQVEGNIAILSSDEPRGLDPEIPCPLCSLFEGIEIVDVSNLAAPTKLSDLPTQGGAHNATLVGSLSLVYISNPTRRSIDIVDISDPRTPRVVKRVTEAAGCETSPYPCQTIAPDEADWDPHDVTFATVPGKGYRLYVAGIEATFILDANNPTTPRVVAKIPNGDYTESYSNIEISHQSDISPDYRLLVVSDERGGGLDVGCPGGGLHVYDVSNESSPVKLGVYFAPDTHNHGNCTVHNFRFLPDRNVLVTAWYSAGSWVIDLSGPAGPGELDNDAAIPGQKTTWGQTLGYAIVPGADTWATKSPGFTSDGRLFMYATDLVRGGLDVFEYIGALPPPAPTATPATPVATATPGPGASPTPACTITYTDVPPGHTFYPFIRCLTCVRIVSGYGDGTFRPGNNVSRGQLSKMVANAGDYEGDPGEQIYKDVPPSHTFYSYINRLTRRGVMSGYDTSARCPTGVPCFRPEEPATRGQTAKIVANAFLPGCNPPAKPRGNGPG